TVREYAAGSLAGEPGSDASRRQHRDYYTSFIEEANEGLRGSGQGEWIERLDQEHDNLRSATTWCQQDAGGGEAGLRLTTALRRFWEMRGHVVEGAARCRVALSHPGAQERTPLRAQTLNAAGVLSWRLADYEAAWNLHAEALL